MQGEFEKKVQAKMEELNVTPSAPVWEKIELQIKPERKRRRVLAWLLLAALLLGGGWFAVVQLGSGNNASTASSSPDKTLPAPATEAPALQRQTVRAKESGKNIVPSLNSIRQQPLHTTDPVVLKKSNNRKVNESRAIAGLVPGQHPAKMKPITSITSEPISEAFVSADQQSKEAGIVQGSELGEDKDPSSKIPTAAADSSTHDQPAIETVLPTDSAAKKKKIAAAGKWKKELLLQGGWSSYPSGAVLSPSYAYSNNGPGSSISSPPSLKTERGGSFAAGIGVSKELTKNVRFSIALQYAFYSVNSKAGAFRRIDTAVSYDNTLTAVRGYYSSSQVTDYNTRLHLLELPVSLGVQFAEKLPLQLSVGASYGRLLHSNALTYLSSYGVAYFNDANNRKDQFNVVAGLQYSLFGKAGWALAIGPQVQYGVTRLQKESMGKAPHLFFAGLKSTIKF